MNHAIIYDILPKEKNSNYLEVDFQELEKYGKRKTRNQFIEFSDKTIGNKKLNEWFEVNGISLWWFVFPTIYPICNDAGFFIDCFESFIEKNKITKIELKGGFDKLSLIKQICDSKKIPIKINNLEKISYTSKKFSENKLKKYVHSKTTSQKHAIRKQKYEKSDKFNPPSECYTLITSPGVYRREIFDFETKKTKNDEYFIGPFLDILKSQNENVLCVDLDYTFKGDLKSLSGRLESEYDWIPVELLFSRKDDKNIQNNFQQLQNTIKNLLKHDMKNFFQYNGISIWNYIQPLFEEIFYESYITTYLRLIYGVEKFFEKHRPKQIIQVYETGPYAKAFEVVAKKFKIKTIGIQHGMWATITPPEYLHQNIQNDSNPLGHPIPDITCVFGEHDKKILTENGNYPTENISVTGNLSLFYLDKIKNALDKKSILEKYNFKNKKIILVPLSSRLHYAGKHKAEVILLEKLFSLFQDDQEKIFLVRPHPGDRFNQQSLSKLCPSENFICSTQSIFEDIFVSDMIVLTYSTVGLEATLFNKPVFYVSVFKDDKSNFSEYYEPFIKNHIIETVSIDDLFDTINSYIPSDIPEMKQNILNYFFNDGKDVNLKNLLVL